MIEWRKETKASLQGVVIASDVKQEWMLPWWWANYTRYNLFPVTFVDFGLSEKGRGFCKQRGELVEIPVLPFIGRKEDVALEKAHFWESLSDGRSWWDKRVLWHKKPIALLQTPYERTIWLDTDCEVKAPLDPLFEQIANKREILICQDSDATQKEVGEKGFILEDEVLFNSGVVGFCKGSEYIKEWAEYTIKEHAAFFGDDTLLSRLIYERKWQVQKLDPLYNWKDLERGAHPDAKISHWAGEAGKFFISLKSSEYH